MINKIGQVMVYVNNQDDSVRFWTEKLGFHIVADKNEQGFRWIEIAATKDSETSIVLHDKEFVTKMSPDLNLDTPSLLFFTDRLDELRIDLLNKKVTVGEIISMPSGRTFNFADNEENYFAVMEQTI